MAEDKMAEENATERKSNWYLIVYERNGNLEYGTIEIYTDQINEIRNTLEAKELIKIPDMRNSGNLEALVKLSKVLEMEGITLTGECEVFYPHCGGVQVSFFGMKKEMEEKEK